MSQATAWITQARPSKLLEMEAEKVGAATLIQARQPSPLPLHAAPVPPFCLHYALSPPPSARTHARPCPSSHFPSLVLQLKARGSSSSSAAASSARALQAAQDTLAVPADASHSKCRLCGESSGWVIGTAS